MLLTAHLVDLHQRRIYPAEITIKDGHIHQIRETEEVPESSGYLMPGFVDAHVHIESSMMPPTEFARLAVVHGTVATVSDPHEIANVLGLAGVQYMLDDAARTPFKFCFGAPSCVPATTFETAGATLSASEVEQLLRRPDIGYLSEMMNFPGVLHADPEVMAKIAAAHRLGKPVDGHAPGLTGEAARQYFAAGITTDHECFTLEEARFKARLGVRILIREGSAARNFEALWPLLLECPDQVMFCSDDKHPDDLIHGHINTLVSRATALGCPLYEVLRAACMHPVEHYRLPVGLLREGDPADLIRVSDLRTFEVLETWLNGQPVARSGQPLLPRLTTHAPNQFLRKNHDTPRPHLFRVKNETPSGKNATAQVRVIEALDGQIVTGSGIYTVPTDQEGAPLPDPAQDVLKITVVNRYVPDAAPAVGFVHGFGLREGALASSVAHDSHNIVAVGCDDQSLAAAVAAITAAQGGICVTNGQGHTRLLPLPIAGLMSQQDGYTLAQEYGALDAATRHDLGCTLQAPFMVLSFLALPVIPSLKITDLGLFDGDQFAFVPVPVAD